MTESTHDMTNITDADREAAAKYAVLPEMGELILSGRVDRHAEPFAAHRELGIQQGRELGAREAISGVVAWLKGQYGDVGDTLADRIERGEHLAATEKGEG